MKISALQAVIDMLLAIREPMTKCESQDGETGSLGFRGLEFVFDYNGDLIMIKGLAEGSDDIKAIIKEKLEEASNNHKELCGMLPEKGSMVDKASYIALGSISALEDLLKCLK